MTAWMLVLLLFGIVNVAAPRLMWELGLVGRRWQFADPAAVQPSDAAIAVNRLIGGVMILIAVTVLVVQFVDAHAPVDTTTDSGALAVRMDERIRTVAATTSRSPRSLLVLRDALDAEAQQKAATECPPPAAASPAAPSHTAPVPTAPSRSPQDWCLDMQRRSLTVLVKPADDYAGTGRVTIGWPNRAVCLTVAVDVHTRGRLRRGACPA